MKNKNRKLSSSRGWIKITGGVLFLALAGFLSFIYFYLPGKVGQGLVARGQVKKPLTQTPQADGFRYEPAAFVSSDGVSLKGWLAARGQKGKSSRYGDFVPRCF